MKNYDELKEIEVFSQEELDDIPESFAGRIYIKFGTPSDRAVVNKKYRYPVEAWDNSSVVAHENSSVEAWDNSSVVARDNSSVVAHENSSVEARDNSYVEAYGNSYVVAYENSSVVARGNSSVKAWENSSVEAYGNSSVEACGNSSVVARENSSVAARDNSSVAGNGNVQIVDNLKSGKINISGNTRIVYNPKNIDEYCDFYGIEHTEKKVKLYKAVHKSDYGYFSDYDSSFEYVIGETIESNDFNDNVMNDCGEGIHLSYKEWAVNYGRNWDGLAILECETDMNSVVVPKSGIGKVRTPKVKVIREVPLHECGLLGKMIEKRRAVK